MSIKKTLLTMVRGEWIEVFRIERYFFHIMTVIAVLILTVALNWKMDQEMLTLQQKKTELKMIKIKHAGKTIKCAEIERIGQVKDLLNKMGSKLVVPEEPAKELKK